MPNAGHDLSPDERDPVPGSGATGDGITNDDTGSDAEATGVTTSSVARMEGRAELDRVLGGEAFARSKRNRDLLAHLANETLEGRADALNGTTVAQDALGKGEDFDPASDPSVRVQMGRLRRLLDTHYEAASGDGDDGVRIVLPKGTYVPRFERTGAPAAPDALPPVPMTAEPAASPPEGAASTRPTGGWRAAVRRWPVAVAAALLLAVALGALVATALRDPLVTLPPHDYPVVVVHAFENRTGNRERDALAAGFQRQFAADLQRFRTARVMLDTGSRQPGVPGMAADYTVTGAVLGADETLDAIIWLIDAHDSTIAATERLTVDASGDDYLEALEEFSIRLTASVAAPRGRLAQAAAAHFDDHHPLTASGGLGPFECLVEFNEFTVNRTDERFAPVHDCLAGEAATHPNDGTLLAALGWMEVLGSPEAGLMDADAIGRDTSLARAVELVDRAVAVAPGNDIAHLHHGLVNWFMGNEEVAIDSMRRAVRLNPADPQHKADYGMFLSYSGEWQEGLAEVSEAIAWDVDPPGWYFLPFFFDALLNGRFDAAEEVLRRGAMRGDPFEPGYRLVLAGAMGDAAEVERWREGAMALATRNGGDALAPIRRWVRLPAILDLMERELRAAGVPVASRSA